MRIFTKPCEKFVVNGMLRHPSRFFVHPIKPSLRPPVTPSPLCSFFRFILNQLERAKLKVTTINKGFILNQFERAKLKVTSNKGFYIATSSVLVVAERVYHLDAARQAEVDMALLMEFQELLVEQNDEIIGSLEFTSESLERQNEELKAQNEELKASLEDIKEMVLEMKAERKGWWRFYFW